MTLTAPVPIHDLRSAILAGRDVTATVHVAPRLGQPIRRALDDGARTARNAIEKNLQPAQLALDDGALRFTIDREPHGDGWILRATWRAL